MFLRQVYKNTFNYSVSYYFVRNVGKLKSNLQCRQLELSAGSQHILPICLNQVRNSSGSSDSNFGGELDAIEFFGEQNVDGDEEKFSLKHLLYPGNGDPILESLNNCSTINQIMEIFIDRKEELGLTHIVQIVILLWNLLKGSNNSSRILRYPEKFDDFLNHLSQFIQNMNADEITCTFLYLYKIGVDASHPTMREVSLIARSLISQGNDVPLSALSRFSVAVHTRRDLHTILNCKEIMPRVIQCLKDCKSAEDLRLITICMHNLVLMVSKDILKVYKNKITELIESGAINKNTVRCILKSINLLNYPHWVHENALLIRELILLLDDEIENLSAKDLETVFRIYQNQMEPALIASKLFKAAEKQYKNTPTLQLLSYIVQFSETHKRGELASTAKLILSKDYNKWPDDCLPSLFKIIRSLKTSDLEICNKFWNGVLNQILSHPEERESYRLLKHCHRYMHFNNNLGGTYRNNEFEKALSKIIMTELSEGVSSVIPAKFARLSSFVLAYGRTENSSLKFPDLIVERFEDMASQFNVIDCLFISRGVQIALGLRFRKYIPPTLASQLVRIDNVLNTSAERHLQSNVNIAEVNFIVRSFNNRKSSRKIPLYQKAISKYRVLGDELNSRLIRDITFNLSSANYLIPEILERIWEYVVKNRNYITGDTVEKVLTCSYNLGFTPTNQDALHWSAEIIKRDFDYMTGLSLSQACLALCFYKTIPDILVNKVFCIDFIKRLEDEIQSCYSKVTYPEKVLNQVMQLNRAVCLDYPECQVPWFQQNYVEAQMTKKPVVQTRFHTDVKSFLISVVKDERFLRCNHITPYGYVVDFVIHLDKNRRPIPAPRETTVLDKITKIAVLPLRFESLCENNPTNIRGHEHLRMRHLEILGYRVIHINWTEWNAMYMNFPGAKVNYLRNLLQIE